MFLTFHLNEGCVIIQIEVLQEQSIVVLGSSDSMLCFHMMGKFGNI